MHDKRTAMNDPSDRIEGRSVRAARSLVSATVMTLAASAALVGIAAGPASASTLDGVATIAPPGLTTPLTEGGSSTPFTVALPAQAACTGDTASDGYHVYSYLVTQATDVSGVTFVGHPSEGYGLFETAPTKYWGAQNTAPTTGQIIGIPNNFEWASANIPLTTLLYAGSGSSASGVWEAGIACANSSGVLTDNWNIEVTFTASSTDPGGFTWTAVPTGDSAAAFTSASSASFTLGKAGSFTPTASGTPTPDITESGTLPTGVTFTGGALTGTPTQSGTFDITFTATNGILSPATQAFTLKVASAGFAISTTSLPEVTPKKAYGPVTLKTSGAGAGATFSWKATGLPKSLTLAATTGVLSGKGSKGLVKGAVYKAKFSVTETVVTGKGTTTKTATKVLPITVG